MPLTNNKYTGYLFILITIIVISISGYIYDNDEITVDLDNTIDGVVQYPPDETDVNYFGFNPRLSPKEDARIYAHVLTNWDRSEMPFGFIEAHYGDYAQLRELAIMYDIIEQEGT